jgi:hypothetical protein
VPPSAKLCEKKNGPSFPNTAPARAVNPRISFIGCDPGASPPIVPSVV